MNVSSLNRTLSHSNSAVLVPVRPSVHFKTVGSLDSCFLDIRLRSAISSLSPDRDVCSLPVIARWKHRKQFKERRGYDRCALLTSPPLPASFPQTGRQVSAPLMHPKAASPAAAAVDKYWKGYPSLKHHSFTYCKPASLWEPGRKTTLRYGEAPRM